MQPRKILIVDDSQMDVLLIKNIILSHSYKGKIVHYYNPLEAIFEIKSNLSSRHKENLPQFDLS